MKDDEAKPDPERRDFVVVTAAAFAGVGALLALWPFVAQMNPHPGTPPSGRVDVDVSAVQPGQTLVVRLHGLPIFLRRRTREEMTRAAHFTGDFHDRFARNDALAPTALARDQNRTLAAHPEWLVVVGLCTHMGCVLRDDPGTTTWEGWVCPCHAARFDCSGRVVSGPAPTNLPVPLYEFVTPTTIRLG